MPRPVPHIRKSASTITQTSDPKECTNVLTEVPLFASLSARHAVAIAEELARRLRAAHTIA